MDNVTLALSISIAVVLVLLFTCWGDKKKKDKKDKKDGFSSAADRLSQTTSATGTGLINKKADARYQDLTQHLMGYEDYNQVAQMMSIEPEVFESHSEYSNDMNRMSSGPSTLAERSDDNYPIKFVGLRRPDMQSVSADPYARVEHSEIPDQMPKQRPYTIL